MICGRKEGSLVQHGSVVSAGSNFGCLTLSRLFWAYLGTAQSGEIFSGDNQLNPMHAIKYKVSKIKIVHDYIQTLCKVRVMGHL